MIDPILSIEHLTHAYGQRTALNDLSLQVQTGEIFGLLGPNGSGKTTLFRILSTLIPLQAGKVTMVGLDLATQRADIRRLIGIVFQAPSLDKQLTAEENLRYQGHLYGLTGAELAQRIDAMLAHLGLGERQKELTGQFSGGMRRRVELAKGLLHRPRLLLLDEPSTGLDPAARIDLWNYLRRIQKEDGVTILMTTHLMEEADQCDRLAIMHRGQRVACDTPTALRDAIGADIITLTGPNLPGLQNAITEKFAVTPQQLDQTLRLERPEAHRFIPTLIEAFPGQITSISLSKPTLQDVFVRATGQTFRNEEDEASIAERTPRGR